MGVGGGGERGECKGDGLCEEGGGGMGWGGGWCCTTMG